MTVKIHIGDCRDVSRYTIDKTPKIAYTGVVQTDPGRFVFTPPRTILYCGQSALFKNDDPSVWTTGGLFLKGAFCMPKRKLPSNETIIALYESGMSSGEIAEKYSVAPVTVLSLFRRIGFKARSTAEAARLRVERGRCNSSKYWQGKKQPAEMVERRVSKVRGEHHYMWKGGSSRRQYRSVIEKIECKDCGATTNLVIHHKNLDHYDNSLDNLSVLCNSCHISLHKTMYWEAIRNGQEPPRSNGPIGWNGENDS